MDHHLVPALLLKNSPVGGGHCPSRQAAPVSATRPGEFVRISHFPGSALYVLWRERHCPSPTVFTHSDFCEYQRILLFLL